MVLFLQLHTHEKTSRHNLHIWHYFSQPLTYSEKGFDEWLCLLTMVFTTFFVRSAFLLSPRGDVTCNTEKRRTLKTHISQQKRLVSLAVFVLLWFAPCSRPTNHDEQNRSHGINWLGVHPFQRSAAQRTHPSLCPVYLIKTIWFSAFVATISSRYCVVMLQCASTEC